MFQEPALTRILECLSAELRPRDRVFSESLGAGFNRITPTQGARSGAAVMMCRDMGMTELKERARIIRSGIQRSYSSMVGTYWPDLLENLRQQFAEHLTSESLKVTGYAAEPWRASVESGCDAVAVGSGCLLPPLSSGGAQGPEPWLRFHTPLIEPDMRISRIRLSDKTSRVHPRRATPKLGQAHEIEVPVQVREWIAPAPTSPVVVLAP